MPKIAISAGHYKYTPGKRCAKQLDANETREWVLNARIAEYLTKILQDFQNVEILRLDDPTGETCITIQQRAKVANVQKADIYIAIHHNAGANLTSSGGIVVYHYPNAKRKASAQKLYNYLISYTGLKGNRCNPVKETTSLYEVTAPNAPSFLIENGFMDSRVDTPIILTEDHAMKTAQAIAIFLVNELGLKEKTAKELNEEKKEKQTQKEETAKNPYCKCQPTRSLQYKVIKMKGDDVKWLQWELNRILCTKLDVDGVFGKLTKEAVINLQKKAKTLEVDGICGPATRKYILNCK